MDWRGTRGYVVVVREYCTVRTVRYLDGGVECRGPTGKAWLALRKYGYGRYSATTVLSNYLEDNT